MTNKTSLCIISIVSESPHAVTNGYTLRVNRFLVNAARKPDIEVHCIAPVTATSIDAALTWATLNKISFHGVLLEKEMQYDKKLRLIFTKKSSLFLSSIVKPETMIIIHGLVSIIDFSESEFAERSVADMIDEIGPLKTRDLVRNLTLGRGIDTLRALKYVWIYYSKTILSLKGYQHISVIAHDDAQRLRNLLPSKSIAIIPNGVDMPHKSIRNPSLEKPAVLFHGVYGYKPNEEAALFLIKSVAPLLKKKCPCCKVVIVGRNPTIEMHEAARFSQNVEIVGEVENLSSYLLTSSVGAYPIFTRTGLQNKILEAWSHGLPVVTTPQVLSVFEAFNRDAIDCARTALTKKEFVKQISDLIDDFESNAILSRNSIDIVKKNFNWAEIVEQFRQL